MGIGGSAYRMAIPSDIHVLRMPVPARLVIVPGWGDDAPEAWRWQASSALAQAARVPPVAPPARPVRQAWLEALAQVLLQQPAPAVLVAHGLGCIAVAQLPAALASRVQGALLVAPVEPERRAVWSDFEPVPHAPLPFRHILVAAEEDPACPIRRAGAYARAWGSAFVRLRADDAIDAPPGQSHWPLGEALLASLLPHATPVRAPRRRRTQPVGMRSKARSAGSMPSHASPLAL